ncbi:MAG: DNA repair protein RecO [Gammaproteobacteria bacterium]|nr:DNA repair protein RecO [Gammaproteobacteria bacterium]
MRVHKEPGFVIHTRPYSETSLYVELFSRQYGRLTTIAKGARRQKSKFRGVLLPFRPLSTGWTGKGEIPILTLAEPAGLWAEMRGQSILCGFYVNELVIRLLHRHDAHPGLFDDYADTMARLRRGEAHESILRLFEKRLLGELGFAMNLHHEAGGQREIDPGRRYRYIPHIGAVTEDSERKGGIPVSGAALHALRTEALDTPLELKECKRLMRAMISHQMENRPLHSRKLFR